MIHKTHQGWVWACTRCPATSRRANPRRWMVARRFAEHLRRWCRA